MLLYLTFCMWVAWWHRQLWGSITGRRTNEEVKASSERRHLPEGEQNSGRKGLDRERRIMSEKGGQKEEEDKKGKEKKKQDKERRRIFKGGNQERRDKGDKGRRTWIHSFQLFLCLEQEVHVTHRFSLHLSFFPFPPTIIKQRHVLEMLGILPEVCTRAKKHQPVWWSTRACLLNSSRWTHDTQVNFLQVPRVLVSSGELLDKIKKKKAKDLYFLPKCYRF